MIETKLMMIRLYPFGVLNILRPNCFNQLNYIEHPFDNNVYFNLTKF